MATLMIDGVPIAEINASTAGALKSLASIKQGALKSFEISTSYPRDPFLMELERSSPVKPTECHDVSLSLRFIERDERIERMVSKRTFSDV